MGVTLIPLTAPLSPYTNFLSPPLKQSLVFDAGFLTL